MPVNSFNVGRYVLLPQDNLFHLEIDCRASARHTWNKTPGSTKNRWLYTNPAGIYTSLQAPFRNHSSSSCNIRSRIGCSFTENRRESGRASPPVCRNVRRHPHRHTIVSTNHAVINARVIPDPHNEAPPLGEAGSYGFPYELFVRRSFISNSDRFPWRRGRRPTRRCSDPA